MKTSTPIPALTTIILATALTLAAPLVLGRGDPQLGRLLCGPQRGLCLVECLG
ncbi:MAG: hypothetical protein IPN92_04270 [Chromatiaceae bacterium]|nr:hypothetical protein [Chromatiaceae bacterium]